MFGNFRAAISKFFKGPGGKPAKEPILEFFLSTLDVRANAIAPRIVGDTGKETLLTKVQAKLVNFTYSDPIDELWSQAWYLERLLALIEPPDGLFLELNRRTNEAIERGIPTSVRLKKTLDSASTDLYTTSKPPKLKDNAELSVRMLLLDALEEIHWTYKRRFSARPLIKEATSRTIWVGIIAFCLFISPYVTLYVALCFQWINKTELSEFWYGLPLWSALTAGLFGAFFSRLIFLQTSIASLSLEAIGDAREKRTIILRGLVGMCGALIVYFFLQSGLIQGSVFPRFNDLGIYRFAWPKVEKGTPEVSQGIQWLIILPSEQLSLLVVWCFLAGFSERLVPNILASTEKTLSDAAQKDNK
jgi:hypothetical protein